MEDELLLCRSKLIDVVLFEEETLLREADDWEASDEVFGLGLNEAFRVFEALLAMPEFLLEYLLFLLGLLLLRFEWLLHTLLSSMSDYMRRLLSC